MEVLPAPMLPTARPLPTAPGWRFEFKFDGIRIACGIRGGRVRRLQTKLGLDVIAKFPELLQVGAVPGEAVLDGELVVWTGKLPDWGAVIQRRHAGQDSVHNLAEARPATVMVFDLLSLDGRDLRRRPYRERRAMLEGLGLTEPWVVPPTSEDSAAMIETSREYGLEGIVAKREASRYRSGRTVDWVKYRHKGFVDAVVVGWERRASGGVTILLAEATGQGLRFVGRCVAKRSIVEALTPLAVKTPAIAVPGASRAVQWVRPVLGVELTAASRAPDGRLRQPKLERVRLDDLG